MTMDLPETILPSFGFQNGAKYQVKITCRKNTTRSFQFAFLTSSEIRDIPQCGAPTKFPHVIWHYPNQDQWIEGTIDKDTVLYPSFRDCYPGISGLVFDGDFRMKNPKSYLDSREQPSLIIQPTIFGIVSACVLFWVIYNVCKKSKLNPLHYAFTILFILFDLLIITEYIYLKNISDHDGSLTYSIIFDVIDIIYLSSLFGTIILVASGWCFIHTDFSILDVALSYLAPALFFGLEAGAHYSTSLILAAVILVGEFAVIAFCLWVAIKKINHARKIILAHMTVIDREGIDPSTTPIADKFLIYTNVFNMVAISIFVYFVTVSIIVILDGPYWIRDLVSALLQLLIFIMFGYYFRPRSGAHGLLFVNSEENDDTQPLIVELDDIDEHIAEKKGVGKAWQPGDKLPKEPILASKEPKKQPLLAGYQKHTDKV